VGFGTAKNWENWKIRGATPDVISILCYGHRIELISPLPIQRRKPRNGIDLKDPLQVAWMDREMERWEKVGSGAVLSSYLFLNPVRLVEKKNSKKLFRMVSNMRKLNVHVEPIKTEIWYLYAFSLIYYQGFLWK